MRKSLALRFAAFYLAVGLCTQVTDFISKYTGYALVKFLGVESSVVSLVLSACLVVAAAVVFSNGVSRDCRRLCARVDRMPEGPPDADAAPGSAFQELEERLDRLGSRLAAGAKAALDAERERDAACEEARAFLAAARGRMEAIAEAGVLRPGGAETAILQEALQNILNAEQAAERVRGRG